MENSFFYSEDLIETIIGSHKRHFNIDLSACFVKCADRQLKTNFENRTGLKINSRIQMSVSPREKFAGAKVSVEVENGVSKILYSLWISNNSNPVTVAWKSKSGRLYTMGDENIDCDDIVFWFEGLDPLLYYNQLYPKETLPFKLKSISYELIVTRINLYCVIEMYLKDTHISAADNLIQQIDLFINSFNTKSEKFDSLLGVVHSWKRQIKDNAIIEYELDLGSADLIFFKQLLNYLSDLNSFSKVVIN